MCGSECWALNKKEEVIKTKIAETRNVKAEDMWCECGRIELGMSIYIRGSLEITVVDWKRDRLSWFLDALWEEIVTRYSRETRVK